MVFCTNPKGAASVITLNVDLESIPFEELPTPRVVMRRAILFYRFRHDLVEARPYTRARTMSS